MRYAITMKDGSVTEMTVLPKAIHLDDGRSFALNRLKATADGMKLFGGNDRTAIKVDVPGELHKDAVQGATIEFHNPAECVAKWPAKYRDQVESIEAMDEKQAEPKR